jgi:DNA repair protein RecN (Recombination protein N)
VLVSLFIKNYAVLKEVDIQFNLGLNVITGETGAGKSVMLGALGLVLGERADSKISIKDDKCLVEAAFNASNPALTAFFERNDLEPESEIILRREISATGKSRAFINDTPVSLQQLKELGDLLVDIHSQHETVSLKDKTYQLDLLDTFAANQNLKSDYEKAFLSVKSLRNELKNLQSQADELRNAFEFDNFQYQELAKADLEHLDAHELENEQILLENAGEIISICNAAADALGQSEDNILDSLLRIASSLKTLAKSNEKIESFRKRLDSVWIELKDVSTEIASFADTIQTDDERLVFVQERLSQLYALQKKHRAMDVNELIAKRNELAEKLTVSSNLESVLENLTKTLLEGEAELYKLGETLRNKRAEAILPLCQTLTTLLHEVGMEKAKVDVRLLPLATPGFDGLEQVELLFTANQGQDLQPLSKVASGGELSRFMLCIKTILAKNKKLPTLIFDEIDTGISGEAAQKTGRLMKKLGKSHQILAITHLPQMTAQGDFHYHIFKIVQDKETSSKIQLLAPEARISQLAQMISGENPGETALNHAKELLSQSSQ